MLLREDKKKHIISSFFYKSYFKQSIFKYFIFEFSYNKRKYYLLMYLYTSDFFQGNNGNVFPNMVNEHL